MNFYSDRIINEIIDNSPLETMIDHLEQFKNQYSYVLIKYSMHSIHHKYTINVINDTGKVVIVFYCLDTDFDVANCPSILIYRKCQKSDEIHYYVLFTCTKRNFRGQGYASKLFDGFLERVHTENVGKPQKIKIILSSLETSVLFYEAYGFKWTRKCISDYPLLLEYEEYDEKKEYFMMELAVDN